MNELLRLILPSFHKKIVNIMINLLKEKIAKLKDNATERSYYPVLCSFFVEFGKSGTLKLHGLQATPEETSTQYEHRIGFPDITIRNNNDLIGWVEVKAPQENLNSEKFQEQFVKYKESLENIIFTNLREWQLWQWVEGESKKTAAVLFDLTDIDHASSKEFESLLIKFFEGRAYQTRTPKQLALVLAKKTRLLSKQVEEALEKSAPDSDLRKLKDTFEKTLIQDIAEHQFANMVAETMAYSLFLAALEHSQRGNGTELTLTNAIDYLPTNVPILADLYSLIKKVAGTIPTIYEATRLLVDQLNAAEIERIHQKLVEHKPGEDPVIQFYEPFLKEYDPKEREARGVYYTPKPVVDYIVKSVDWLLRNKFDKAKGLADESVHLLDPATGTGTFLMSAIQEIHSNIKRENVALGDEMVRREFNKVVLSHILKHFYGFELLIAPYAIAHLKLTLEVERLGFDFALTKKDGDSDNDRFKVYLANTLDDPRPKQLQAAATSDFGAIAFPSIPRESESAREVKKNVPILVIVGNPPYSNYGRMNRGKWILNLLKDYKKDLKEKKINLNEESIKFIRFAQWKLNETKQGIFAMITSNTFIDGITHRQMRRALMDTYDEIYIYNLHGSIRKGETSQDNRKDENVFENITQGVSINIFVKHLKKQPKTIVKYCELWGKRNDKFALLLDAKFMDTKWQTLTPKEPNLFFVKRHSGNEDEYSGYTSITEIFPHYNSGIQTKRDALTIQYEEATLNVILRDFNKLAFEEFRQKYKLPIDGRDWKIADAKKDLQQNNPKILNILYRPFDVRKTIFTGKIKGFIAYPRTETMKHMLKQNIGLITSRQQALAGFRHISVTNTIIESAAVSIKTKEWNYLFPLYLYPEKFEQLVIGESVFIDSMPRPNINSEIGRKIAGNIDRVYCPADEYPKEGISRLTPEEIFYYTYAILHSPIYRTRYAEQLKIDFPRLPLTSDKKLFAQLVTMGNELVNLHLLGENHFDKSKTIFDEPGKWSVKIGGVKPDKLPDWQVTDVRYDEEEKRVYVNKGQYFEGVEKEVWEFMIGSYQVCETWLKYRKKAERALSTDDLKHYMKIVVSLRETIRLMQEIDKAIPSWPIQ
jgi:predicted helicase